MKATRNTWLASTGPAAPTVEARTVAGVDRFTARSEEHTSELQSQSNLVCRLLLEKKKQYKHQSARRTKSWAGFSSSREWTLSSPQSACPCYDSALLQVLTSTRNPRMHRSHNTRDH